MPAKPLACYRALFRFIAQQAMPTLAPLRIVTDYETALQRVCRENWPNAQKIGCHFHFAQVSMFRYCLLLFFQMYLLPQCAFFNIRECGGKCNG